MNWPRRLRTPLFEPGGVLAELSPTQQSQLTHKAKTLAAVFQRSSSLSERKCGFDHGVGHSLLLLYDAKTPRGQKIKEFKGLGRDPSNTSISLFQIITKYFICISV